MCYISPSRVLPLVFLPFYHAVIQCVTVFIWKNSEKNPPYVLRIRLKSLLLHPLSETERRSVDMMAGFSVLRSRVFFRSFFRTLSGPRKKSRGKVWRICGKVPIFAAAFPSRPGGVFRERLRSLKCWWTKEDTVQEEPFPFGPRPFRKGRNRHFLD